MVLVPLSIESLKQFFDETAIKVIKYFISKSIFAQPETLEGQSDLPIQVPKEHIEQWAVQALGVTPVGSGSYPVDVIKADEWGADVKMVSCKIEDNGDLLDRDSGETSLAQKFAGTGSELDDLFNKESHEEILDGWSKIMQEKIQAVKDKKNLHHIYYFIILRAGLKFYLCGLEVNTQNFDDIEVLKTSGESVWASNFIDEKYGSVKVYKAKKRMELRLRPSNWLKDDLLIEFQVTDSLMSKNIREIINDEEKFNLYKDEITKEIFN